MSEYFEQLKAFFHYTFQHAFLCEFGIRIVVEIFALLLITYFVLKFILKIISKIIKIFSTIIDFIVYDILLPICKVVADQIAYRIGSPRWQAKADKIKQIVNNKEAGSNKQQANQNKKKKKLGWYFFTVFIILVAYLEAFHYWFPNVKENYPVFFLFEDFILKSEDSLVNVVFETNEEVIPCFYDLMHKNN